jgi:hypothetical protein
LYARLWKIAAVNRERAGGTDKVVAIAHFAGADVWASSRLLALAEGKSYSRIEIELNTSRPTIGAAPNAICENATADNTNNAFMGGSLVLFCCFG